MSNDYAVGENPPFDVTIDRVTVALDSTVEETNLLPAQEARVTALYHARSVLEDKGAMGVKNGSRLTKPTGELLLIAHYIINGSFVDGDDLD